MVRSALLELGLTSTVAGDSCQLEQGCSTHHVSKMRPQGPVALRLWGAGVNVQEQERKGAHLCFWCHLQRLRGGGNCILKHKEGVGSAGCCPPTARGSPVPRGSATDSTHVEVTGRF